MQDGAAEIVAQVRHGHAGCGPDPADAAEHDRHRPFPVSEDMSDAGADGRARRIAPPDVPAHGPATRLPAVDRGAMAPRLRPGPVPRRAVTGVRPDGSVATGRVRNGGRSVPVMPGRTGACPAADGTPSAVDADMVPIPEARRRDAVRARIRSAPFGLPGPGISGCPAGVGVFPRRPGGTVRPDTGRAPARPGPFPSFPRHPPAWGRDRSGVHGPAPAGPLPRSRSRSPEAADRDVNAPPRASLSRNGRTVLRSGAGPPVRNPENRGRPGRSVRPRQAPGMVRETERTGAERL